MDEHIILKANTVLVKHVDSDLGYFNFNRLVLTYEEENSDIECFKESLTPKTKEINFCHVFDYIINNYKLYEKLISCIKKDDNRYIKNTDLNYFSKIFRDLDIYYIYEFNFISYLLSGDNTRFDDSKLYNISLYEICRALTYNEEIKRIHILKSIIGTIHLIYLVYVNLCIDNNYRKIIIKEYLNFINFFRDNISIYEWNSDSKSIYEPKVIDNNIIASSNDFNNSKKVSSLYDYELKEALNIINPSWVSNLELRTGEGGIKYDIRK